MNDPSAPIVLLQMILSWTLLGVLLAWLLVCAFLAFYPQRVERSSAAELPTPTGAFPAYVSQTALYRPHLAVKVARGNTPAVSTDLPTLDVGATPIA